MLELFRLIKDFLLSLWRWITNRRHEQEQQIRRRVEELSAEAETLHTRNQTEIEETNRVLRERKTHIDNASDEQLVRILNQLFSGAAKGRDD